MGERFFGDRRQGEGAALPKTSTSSPVHTVVAPAEPGSGDGATGSQEPEASAAVAFRGASPTETIGAPASPTSFASPPW